MGVLPSSMVSKSRLRHPCTDPIKWSIVSFHWSEQLDFPVTWWREAKHWQAAIIVSLSVLTFPSREARHNLVHWSAICRDWEGKLMILLFRAVNTTGYRGRKGRSISMLLSPWMTSLRWYLPTALRPWPDLVWVDWIEASLERWFRVVVQVCCGCTRRSRRGFQWLPYEIPQLQVSMRI